MASWDEVGLAERLYDAALEADLWENALQLYAEDFGGVGVAILQLDPVPNLLSFSPGVAEMCMAYRSGWHEFDTLLNVSQQMGYASKPGIYWDVDFISPNRKAQDGFYQEFLKTFGAGAVVSSLIRPHGSARFVVNVERRLGAAAPEAEDRGKFAAMSRHLSRALAIRQRLDRAEATAGAMAGTLAEFDCAVAVTDQAGRIVQTNAAFDALRSDGMLVRDGRVRLGNTVLQQRFDSALSAVCRGASVASTSDTLIVPRTDSLLPLLIRVTPLSGGASERILDVRPTRGALIIVLNPDHRAYPDLSAVLVALGLTPAQARLSQLFASGHTTRSAAELLAVSEETTRSTIKSVYARLGIASKEDLARLIQKAVPFR